MANFPSLSKIAATAASWTLPATTLTTTTTTTTMATPTISTAIPTAIPTTSSSTPTPSPLPTLSQPTTSMLPRIPLTVQNTQGDCVPQAPGHGPTPREDTAHSFTTSHLLLDPSLTATTPYGYTLAFRSLNASYIGSTYLGFSELTSYSASECASACLTWGGEEPSASNGEPDAQSPLPFPPGFDVSATAPTSVPPPPRAQVCNSFNIYYERSPAVHLGPQCTNSGSRTVVKCALWGEADMREEGATNTGYTEWDFEVVIAGSNGYRYGGEEYGHGNKSEGEKAVAPHATSEVIKRVLLGMVGGLLVAGIMGY